jgi:ABC-type transport system involved in multi-copper enzyme maturation permease subunit
MTTERWRLVIAITVVLATLAGVGSVGFVLASIWLTSWRALATAAVCFVLTAAFLVIAFLIEEKYGADRVVGSGRTSRHPHGFG